MFLRILLRSTHGVVGYHIRFTRERSAVRVRMCARFFFALQNAAAATDVISHELRALHSLLEQKIPLSQKHMDGHVNRRFLNFSKNSTFIIITCILLQSYATFLISLVLITLLLYYYYYRSHRPDYRHYRYCHITKMPRGGTARRGRGSYKVTTTRSERESALERLGKVIYPKAINDKNPKKYKFVRNQAVNTCIVTLPGETRIKALTKKFLKSYYDIFDQPGRLNLESQYSVDAFFSFSSTHPMPSVGRNILEVRDPGQRLSMLIHDRTNIAKALATFSPTEHNVNHLTVDVPYYLANPMYVTCLHLTVTGVFRDTSQTTNPLRAFTRIFVLKHTSTDKQGDPNYQIFNDIFMLQVPTPNQIKKYHSDAQEMKKQSFQQSQQPNSSYNSTGGPLQSKFSKERLIESIMAKTRMNRVGSTKLLEDFKWSEDESMKAFNKLYQENRVPQEFFTQ